MMRLSSIFNQSNIRAFFKIAKEKNFSTLLYRTIYTIKDTIQYPKWYKQQILSKEELDIQCTTTFSYNPLISIIVPTFCTPIPFLCEMLDSLRNQTYTNWELCIADASITAPNVRNILKQYEQLDARIHVTYLKENKNISENTNSALLISSGEYLGLLDHDDILAPNTLFEIVKALNNTPDIDVIYTDEDKIDSDSSIHYYPNFKPDYNPHLLRSCNYICHFFVFKRTLMDSIGLFKAEFNGSQDYNYILRATKAANQIYHIPKMLYHWRVHSNSVASNPTQKLYCYNAALNAIQENLDTSNISGKVDYSHLFGFYNTVYDFNNCSSVTIITPEPKFKIQNCNNLSVKICVINSISLDYIKQKTRNTPNDFIVFFNKGISTVTENTLLKMISYFADKKVGATTPKITKHGKTVALGMFYHNGTFKNCYANIPANESGFYGRNLLDQNVPFCSPYVFVCRQNMIYEFSNNNIKHNILTFSEFAIIFSLFLYEQEYYIVGTANIHIDCSKKISIDCRKELLNKKEDLLNIISQLYIVPPYYK